MLDDDLTAARAATAGLLTHLGTLCPDQLARSSLLPSWSRAQLVAHLAGNARSHVRLLEGCLAGEVRDQYPDGSTGREDAIGALAADPAAAVTAHRTACAELERCWRAMGPEHWARDVRPLDEPPRPATGLVWSRCKEVLVHRVDLAAGYSWRNWPDAFADRLLRVLLDRADLPAMTLDALGGASSVGGDVAGDLQPVVGGGVVVTGTPAALAAWLSGRSGGHELRADGPLPPVPPWA